MSFSGTFLKLLVRAGIFLFYIFTNICLKKAKIRLILCKKKQNSHLFSLWRNKKGWGGALKLMQEGHEKLTFIFFWSNHFCRKFEKTSLQSKDLKNPWTAPSWALVTLKIGHGCWMSNPSMVFTRCFLCANYLMDVASFS